MSDAITNVLRGMLQQELDARADDEQCALRSSRVLRISLNAAAAPDWKGDAVVLMAPAPASSADARWAAAFGVDASQAPSPGEWQVVARPQAMLLVVGTVPEAGFGYPQVQEYAVSCLAALKAARPDARSLALALPGSAHGLDECACVEHMLQGFVQVLSAELEAGALNEVVLLETSPDRHAVIGAKLAQLLHDAEAPKGWRALPLSWPLVYFPCAGDAERRVPAPYEAHLNYNETLTAFVAMPFTPKMVDVFTYGIQGPALRSRFRAERLDFEHFTGSVIDQIKERIQRAHLVIADMTGANPNVFLEIGYALGKGRPMVLLWQVNENDPKATPPFDVVSDSRIEYKQIGELDRQLTVKLQKLYPELRKRAQSQS